MGPQGVAPLLADDPVEVGGFRLRGRLGQGGMGRVYLGLSPGGRAVAVKVVHPALARDPEFRSRFRREIAAARGVNGTYTAPVVAAGPDDEIPWLATAYVPGPSLAALVRAHGPVPEDALWRLAGGLAEALADIHAGGLIHRDLKPENVLLAGDGPKVIDFGISRVPDGTAITVAGTVLGTPAFMSPEQVAGEPAGEASDVFSLGSVLAFAATGRCPFGEGGLRSVAYGVLHREPDLDGVPPPLRQLIGSCMAKESSQRPGLATVMHAIAGHPDDDIPVGSFWPAEFGMLLGARQAAKAAPATAPSVRSSSTASRSSRAGLPRMRRGLLAGLVAGSAAAAVVAAVVIASYAAISQHAGASGGSGPSATVTPTALRPASPTTSRQPAALPVPTLLGAPDFNGYCQAHGEGNARVNSAAYAYGWLCTHQTSLGDEAQATCLWTYNLPASEVTNTLTNFYDPNTWQCWRAHRQLAPPDWNGYCASHGLGTAQLAPAQYAYGWHCTGSGNGLSDEAVCEWTNHARSVVIGRFQDFYDPNSWQCWV